MAENKQIVYFVARIGGWDGIAMQAEIWMQILLDLGYQITLVTGEIDTEPGELNKELYDRITLIELESLKLENQKELFELAKRDTYDRESWLPEFISEKAEIKAEFADLIQGASKVFLHNFSIKHLISTAWAAMHELIIEHKEQQFIALDADSPYERSKILETLDLDFVEILGNYDLWYGQDIEQIKENLDRSKQDHNAFLPGPDMLPNLYHICLNTVQKRIAQNIYGIDDTHIASLPDIGLFHESNNQEQTDNKDLLNYLKQNIVCGDAEINKDQIYVISPVRPIERKKLHAVAQMCKQFEKHIQQKGEQKEVILVITHPNKDEQHYFQDLSEFCCEIQLTFIHLNDLKLRKKEGDETHYTYDQFMSEVAMLHSLSVVGSEFGGWENGILESTEYKIPVVVNPHLPSYQDMSSFGFEYIPMPIEAFDTKKESEGVADLAHFFEKISELLFNTQKRQENVECNFKTGEREQSARTASKIIQEIFKR